MNHTHWLEVAKNLPLGHKTRVDCNKCGVGTNTNAMLVSHGNKAYSGFCFACDNKPYQMKGIQTLEELAEIRRLNNEPLCRGRGSILELPEDFTNDIPVEGRLWLYSNGITEKLKKLYNIGYSKRLQRVVLPVYDSKGTLIWYQCRALLKGQRPKYLQPSLDKSSVVFESKHRETSKNTAEVVIVEDIMSAIRVGEWVRASSFLGTKATQAQINRVARFDKVTIWYDNDKAGKNGSRTIKQALSMVTKVREIHTELDPKAYSKQQIEEILK